jgi:hypothetical protein
MSLGGSKRTRKDCKLNGIHQFLAFANNVIIVGENIYTMQKNKEALVDASKEVGLEVNLEKISMCYHHIIRRQEESLAYKVSE